MEPSHYQLRFPKWRIRDKNGCLIEKCPDHAQLTIKKGGDLRICLPSEFHHINRFLLKKVALVHCFGCGIEVQKRGFAWVLVILSELSFQSLDSESSALYLGSLKWGQRGRRSRTCARRPSCFEKCAFWLDVVSRKRTFQSWRNHSKISNWSYNEIYCCKKSNRMLRRSTVAMRVLAKTHAGMTANNVARRKVVISFADSLQRDLLWVIIHTALYWWQIRKFPFLHLCSNTRTFWGFGTFCANLSNWQMQKIALYKWLTRVWVVSRVELSRVRGLLSRDSCGVLCCDVVWCVVLSCDVVCCIVPQCSVLCAVQLWCGVVCCVLCCALL